MEPNLVEELRPLFAGRKLVLTGAPLAALTGGCRRVRDLGAERPFLTPGPWGRHADREVMRALARRVGEGLRERVGYRGRSPSTGC